jgi:rRNA maturation endonuclease Nob1
MRLEAFLSRHDAIEVTTFASKERVFLHRGGVIKVKNCCEYCRNIVSRDPKSNCWSCGAPVVIDERNMVVSMEEFDR